MEAIFLDCGAGGPQLKRNPLGGCSDCLGTMAPLSSSPGTVEQTQSHRVSKQLIYIEPETEDRAGAPRWYAWFGTWDPFQEGEELIVTLADGRKGTGIVRRVYIDADLVDPIVYVDGNGTLE